MRDSAKTVVIGGGLIGLLTALKLSEGGSQVTLLDKGQPGKESSWAGGGILSPLYPWRYPPTITNLALWGQERYATFAAQLLQETGVDPEWTRSGMLIANVDANERDEAVQWAFRFGYDLEAIHDHFTLCSIEPGLGTRIRDGLWMPYIAQIRTPRLLRALLAKVAPEITIYPRKAAWSLWLEGGRVAGVDAGTERIKADQVVIAGGAWSAALLDDVGVELPVWPIRGQMILLRGEPETISRIILHDERYVIPRRDGHVLVGSTLEDVGFEKTTTRSVCRELLTAACDMCPVFENFTIEKQWAGLRPASPNGIPFIGAVPGVSGLFVNTGHFRNGVVLSYASAQLVADIIFEREPVVEPTPYAVGNSRA